jgi:hypothetical protein
MSLFSTRRRENFSTLGNGFHRLRTRRSKAAGRAPHGRRLFVEALEDRRLLSIFADMGSLGMPGVENSSVAWGDYDNDGKLDILLTGYAYAAGSSNYIAKVYHNNGNGTFTENTSAGLPGVYDGSVAWGDYDSDGKLDVLLTGITGSGSSITKVYHNLASTADRAPDAPTGLAAAPLSPTSVRLSWAAPTDDQTPASGLSYDLRVGTAPGASDVVGLMADASTGERRLAQRGSIQATSWTLSNLAPDTRYYWSVQAVDGALAGSGFANEGTFITDVAPPTVSLTAPALTNSMPSVTVTASDSGSGVPDGTTVGLDVDLNNDGDFADAGEANYMISPLTGGSATFRVFPPLAEGTYRFRARVRDGAFNEGAFTLGGIVVDTTPPTVAATAPSLAGGTLAAGTASIQVQFSEPVLGGDTAANYQFQSLGRDGLLGTVDDAIITLSPNYAGTTATLSFDALPESVYRLTVRDTITDVAGNRLDGNGTAGGAWVQDFVVGPLALEWLHQVSDSTGGTGGGSSIARDPAGNLYVLTSVTGALPVPALGNSDALLSKYDANGNLVWFRRFGTSGNDMARSIAVDHTGAYVAGFTGGSFSDPQNGQASGGCDAFVRRYTDNDSNFILRQTVQFGTSGFEEGREVFVSNTASPSQGVYVVGDTTGALGQSNAGGSDAFVRKYSLDLQTVLWTKQFGTSATDYGTSVCGDGSALYVAGYTEGAFPG